MKSILFLSETVASAVVLPEIRTFLPSYRISWISSSGGSTAATGIRLEMSTWPLLSSKTTATSLTSSVMINSRENCPEELKNVLAVFIFTEGRSQTASSAIFVSAVFPALSLPTSLTVRSLRAGSIVKLALKPPSSLISISRPSTIRDSIPPPRSLTEPLTSAICMILTWPETTSLFSL